jgi:hypothetical protein
VVTHSLGTQVQCVQPKRGNLKGKVYKNNPRSIEALQNEITRVIGSIAVDQLQKVSHNLVMRCEACLRAEVITFNTCYKAR